MYRTHWRHLLAISFAVYLVIAALTLLVVALLADLGVVIAGFVAIAGIFWLQGALVIAIEDVRDGRVDLSVGETFERLRPRLNALSLAALGVVIFALAAGFVIVLGLFLFIIPGLVLIGLFAYLLVRWILLVPVLVLEKRGIFAALDRSAALVRGSGWNVFFVIVLTVLILLAFSIALGLVLSPLPREIETALSQLSSAITAPFAALAWTLMYYRLREPEAAPPAAPV